MCDVPLVAACLRRVPDETLPEHEPPRWLTRFFTSVLRYRGMPIIYSILFPLIPVILRCSSFCAKSCCFTVSIAISFAHPTQARSCICVSQMHDALRARNLGFF
jgi:hypothetical protein